MGVVKQAHFGGGVIPHSDGERSVTMGILAAVEWQKGLLEVGEDQRLWSFGWSATTDAAVTADGNRNRGEGRGHEPRGQVSSER